MQLLNLINGFPGAPSGTAEVFVSGSTASLATVYADAAGAATLTNPVVLDANGSATAYVDTIVDVVIKTSTGAIVKARYTPEGVDSLIETSGPSFTGANPVTGALAVNQPIGLDTVLDRWVASAGAPDWKVRRTGQAADETLKTAFAAVTGANLPFFNVRTYGALGDGATDDAVAFEATVAAAILAGGGIVFVPGTTTNFLLSRAILILSPKVSFLGVGPLGSVLKSSGAFECLTFTGSVTTGSNAFCHGIGFTSASASASRSLSIASCPGFVVSNCRGSVNAPHGSGGVFYATCRATFRDCSFANPSAANQPAIHFINSGAGGLIQRCTLEATSTITCLALAMDNVTIDGCFHESGATSTQLVTSGTGTGRTRIINCHALTGKWVFGNSFTTNLIESGNTYADSVSITGTTTGGAGFGATALGNSDRFDSRQAYSTIAAGATYIPRTDIETHYVTITLNTAISAPVVYNIANGAHVTFVFFNSTAGALNVTWNAAYDVGVGLVAVGAGLRYRMDFVYVGSTLRAMNTVMVF